MKKVRVAVIGYGHLGKWHCQKVEASSEVADFVAIVEPFAESQELARKNHPHVKIVGSIEEVISEIDAAFIVTPTSMHFKLAKLLLSFDKHIFCEKPVCSNFEEALELKKISEDKNLVFQVGHSERFHEVWNLIRENLSKLKPPYQVRINRVAAFKGRATDVDVIQDLAIHDLDLILFLFKDRPVKLFTKAFKVRTDNLDHASIFLKLENECQVEITVSRNHVKEMRDVEIVSENGLIFIDLFQNKYSIAHSKNFEDGSYVKEFSYEKRDHLLLEHQAFYQSILTGSEVVVSLVDGIKAVQLVDLSLQSSNSNQEVSISLYE
jgi:predicted dehydrogenase